MGWHIVQTSFMRRVSAALLVGLTGLAYPQAIDKDYTKKILEYTTEKFFLTELVDSLPFSKTVPTPLKYFGTIIGAPNLLHYVEDINGYMRALDKASDRVQVISMGQSEEGREMIVVVISDAANLRGLKKYQEITAKLGDPRKLVGAAGTNQSALSYTADVLAKADGAAEKLIAEGLPFYYMTAGMHSPESGPPEMVMELAYRLAVSETPFIQNIRKNTITMITPVLETDGRDRYVDTYMYRKKNPTKPPIPLLYWGKYVAHDNNRDGMANSLALSKNLMKTWFEFRPQVMHDLHESVSFLYISTGTGPYNPWLDPITIDEWHEMAYNEVAKFTTWGVPGVWTHGFYDGWAPNYAFYAANGHNAIGRFYETQGGSGADTRIINVGEAATRDWFRPNPPLSRVRWSLRNNTNLMQSGVLLALDNMATNKAKFLRNYYLKSKRSVLKARTEGPAAWVLPASETRTRERDALLELLRRQGVEVSVLDKETETKDGKFGAGSLVVRMDQPYSRMADMLLDKQYFKADDPRPYDDTGWTLGPLFNVETVRVKDTAILDAPVRREGIRMSSGPLSRWWNLVPGPRTALVHTWQNTQDEGWMRLALDEAKVPYNYTSVHTLRDTPNLKDKFDVIIIGPAGGTAQSIVNGVSREGEPIPWKPLEGFKHLGGPDTTDNIRGGIELQGMLNLQKFLNDGGLLITIGNSSRLPIDYGLVSGVSMDQSQTLFAPGGVYRVTNAAKDNPVMAGYQENFAIYYSSRSGQLSMGGGGFGGGGGRGGQQGGGGRVSGRGDRTDPDIIQGRPPYTAQRQPGDAPDTPPQQQPTARPQVLLRFAPLENLLLSGGLDKGEELAGRPALILAPSGKGNVLLFGFNPMWRQQTHGSWSMVFNAIMNWDKLRTLPKKDGG